MAAKHRRPFDWTKPCAFNPEQKKSFHREAKRRLKLVAEMLGWRPSDYDLASTPGGNAVTGEITLHHAHVYLQVSQFRLGLMLRSCKGRKDYTGGDNTWVPLALMDDLPALAAHVARIAPASAQQE